jgi:hypothetical protein
VKVSFNGARINLARAYNDFYQSIESDLQQHQKDKLRELRSNIFGFLCMYEEGNPDCKELDIKLDGGEDEG